MTKIEEIEQKIKDLTAEVNQLKQTASFEVGKVYKNEFGAINMYVANGNHYGFNTFKEWTNNNFWFENDCNGTWQPATTEEWETALIEYAKKQGFKSGVTVERSEEFLLHCGIKKEDLKWVPKLEIIRDDNFIYDSDSDILLLGGKYIYGKGQWASIVKEQPLMIGGVEVEIKNNTAIINGCIYYENDLLWLIHRCKNFNKPITTELLTKIIDKLK
jgi:hypothetical protein